MLRSAKKKVEENMANQDLQKGFKGGPGNDLECDGSDLDLLDRFKSIRCDSGIGSEITDVTGGSLHCAFEDANCEETFCRRVGEMPVIEEKCSDTEEQKTYQESTCVVSEDILNGYRFSVYTPAPVTTAILTSPRASVDIYFDTSRYSDSKQRERKQTKRGYWEFILKPDKDGDNLIFIAILLDKFDLCLQMLTLIPSHVLIRARRNIMFQTALHLAALTDNAKLVRRFVVAGVQVDRQDKFGNTALHIACKRGNTAVAEALLYPVRYGEAKQNGYDISYQRIPQNMEIRNYEGQTCFMIAASNCDTAMMDLLISKHADINVKDIKSGMTCLHSATESRNVEVVQYLLKKDKTDINTRTYSGYTALDIANIRGQSYVAYLLLCAGAKPELKSVASADCQAESDFDDKDSD